MAQSTSAATTGSPAPLISVPAPGFQTLDHRRMQREARISLLSQETPNVLLPSASGLMDRVLPTQTMQPLQQQPLLNQIHSQQQLQILQHQTQQLPHAGLAAGLAALPARVASPAAVSPDTFITNTSTHSTQQQHQAPSQASQQIKAYANRFRKPPAVILTGSHIRPKPRPPPPPPPAPVKQEDQKEPDDEPSLISELIRGSASSNVSQDPYSSFFDDIKGWDEDVGEDLVSKLLTATGSATYKYLTCDIGAVRPGEERPISPSAIRRRPFRRRSTRLKSVPVLRATLEDMGEESSSHANALLFGVGAEEDAVCAPTRHYGANMVIGAATGSVKVKADSGTGPLQADAQSLPTLGEADPHAASVESPFPPPSSPSTQQRSRILRARKHKSAASHGISSAATHRSAKSRTRQSTGDTDDDQTEKGSREQRKATAASSASKGSSGAGAPLPDSVGPENGSSQDWKAKQWQPSPSSRRDLFDPQHPDSLLSPATERMALLRKKLISSATSAKVHWRSSQAGSTSQLCESLSSTVITGRKYTKADPADRHGHFSDDTSVPTTRRAQTAGIEGRNDKTMLPLIQSSSIRIMPGESALNPIVKGFARPQTSGASTDAMDHHVSLNTNMLFDGTGGISSSTTGKQDSISSAEISANSGLQLRLSHSGTDSSSPTYFVVMPPQQPSPQTDVPVWFADTAPAPHRSASLDRFTSTLKSGKAPRAPKKLSQRGFQPAILLPDTILKTPKDGNIGMTRVDTLQHRSAHSATAASSRHKLQPSDMDYFADDQMIYGHHHHHHQQHQHDAAAEPRIVAKHAELSDQNVFDLKITRPPCVDTFTASKPIRSFRDQIQSNRSAVHGA